MSEFEHNFGFSTYFISALMLLSLNVIPNPLIRYAAFLIAFLIVFVMVLHSTPSIGIIFIFAMFGIELGLGFGLPMLQSSYDVDLTEWGLATKIICDGDREGNIFKQDIVLTNFGRQADFCTTTKSTIATYAVDSCTGVSCYLVELKCKVIERDAEIVQCPFGCKQGRCVE